MLTPEQFNDGEEKFAALKAVLNNVEGKYSMSYHEPVLDLPPSLELVPLEYTPLTDLQLQQLAESEVNAWFFSEREKLRKWYVKELDAIDKKLQKALKTYGEQRSKYQAELVDQTEKTKITLRDNGMSSSSVYTHAFGEISDKYDLLLEDAESAYDQTVADLQEEKDALDEELETREDAIDDVKQEKIAVAVAKLQENEQKQEIAIEKYNQSLAERETKYKASIGRTKQYAVQAEYSRALEACKLFSQLGESGVREQMLYEKFTLAKEFCDSVGKEVALTFIQSDSFVMGALGTYYNALLDYIDTMPD